MPIKTLFITPPLTQLNTSYPASPYLKGFLKLHGHEVFQADLSIEVMNAIFSQNGFSALFDQFPANHKRLSRNSQHILSNADMKANRGGSNMGMAKIFNKNGFSY